MKLQINERGSWREMVEFAPERLKEVKAATLGFARAVGPGNRIKGASYRVTKDGRSALAYLEAPYATWRDA
jgi:hypothetical protein